MNVLLKQVYNDETFASEREKGQIDRHLQSQLPYDNDLTIFPETCNMLPIGSLIFQDILLQAL